MGRLLGIKREDCGGIGTFSPGKIQVPRVVEEDYLLKGRGIQHSLPDKIGESKAEDPDDPWFPRSGLRDPIQVDCVIASAIRWMTKGARNTNTVKRPLGWATPKKPTDRAEQSASPFQWRRAPA